MAFGDFKDLLRRTVSDKVLSHKTFNIAINPKYDGCHRSFASMLYELVVLKIKSSKITN